MFDFYPTCLEKNKHVGIFTPGCYFPHMFGFWHTCMGKDTHVWKKPHNYMFANVWFFPHMCGKSHRPAYFPLSYRCPRGGLGEGRQRVGDDQRLESVFSLVTFFLQKNDSPGKVLERRRLEEARQHSRPRWAGGLKRQRQGGAASGATFHKIYWN